MLSAELQAQALDQEDQNDGGTTAPAEAEEVQ